MNDNSYFNVTFEKIKFKSMAKSKVNSTSTFSPKPKKKRPGIHSKKKFSKLKSSKLYKKLAVGQG